LSAKNVLALALVVACTMGAQGAFAAPADDRILPVNQYTSEKARTLGTTHARALRELNAGIYHCMPWVEVQKNSIGFFRPKHMTGDERYLSLRIYIEQDPSPEFARFRIEERASAMFSRYVGPLLRRMTKDPAIAADPAVDGYTIILEWLKQTQQASSGDRPVHETIAIFIDKAAASRYLAGTGPITEVAAKARVLGFDGETALGPLRVAVWDDNFVTTYKVANYVLEPGVTCGGS
jgi:hypothetical protein